MIPEIIEFRYQHVSDKEQYLYQSISFSSPIRPEEKKEEEKRQEDGNKKRRNWFPGLIECV